MVHTTFAWISLWAEYFSIAIPPCTQRCDRSAHWFSPHVRRTCVRLCAKLFCLQKPALPAALLQMEDHYAVLSLKNAPGPAVRESAKGGRSNSLRNDRAGGLLRENMSRKPLSSKHKSSLSGGDRVKDERSIRSGSKRGRRPERRGAASKARRENSRVLSSASVTSKRGRGKGLRGKGTVTELSDRRSRSPPAERRKNQRAHPDDAASKVPRQTYLSARAFMDQHFPREDMQVGS